jgi:hypothetical protein
VIFLPLSRATTDGKIDLASTTKTESEKASKKDNNMDFGKGFSKNLRGAFM